MSSKYDVENLLADINSLLVNNVNAYIDAVETEKVSQGLPTTNLAEVDLNSSSTNPSGVNGLFVQSWTMENLNFNPAIFYGIEQIESKGVGPATMHVYKVFVEVIFADRYADNLGLVRLNRYARALQDLFEQKYDKLPVISGKINIETVRPISFKLDTDSSEEVRVGGVSITLAIA